MTNSASDPAIAGDVVAKAEAYYDSGDADNFYFNIWGGEDIHVGLYEQTDDISLASRRTVEEMARLAAPIDANTTILDVGAGYGGAARYLAKTFGCQVVCVNLSRTQNATNERLTREQGLDHLIRVVYGNFEEIPEADAQFDLVWSQDAILHSGRRETVLREIDRVLKPGGRIIFTDPMQSDDCPDNVLQAVYDRIHLDNLGSFAFYRAAARSLGWNELAVVDLTANLRRHYQRVGEELRANYERMAKVSSTAYLDRMLAGLGHWVAAADKGYLAWGIMVFKKPA